MPHIPIRQVHVDARRPRTAKRKSQTPSVDRPLRGVMELDNAGGVPSVSAPVSFALNSGQLVGLYAVSTDANPSDSVSDNGGARVVDGHLELIFWGSQWQTAVAPSAPNIVAAVQTLLAGSYLSELQQYGFQRISLRGATIFLTPAPPTNFQTSDVEDVVWGAIDQGIFPEPDDSGGRNIYLVFLPTGTNPPSPARGAHSDPSDYDFPFDVDYAWVGWVSPGTLDYTMDVFSHELVEAITDPEPSDGWIMSRNINGGNEIGDACNNTADRVDNLLLQAYWSEELKACALPFGPPSRPSSFGDVAAICRTPEHIDVFWSGSEGSIQTVWWDENANNGKWNTPFYVTRVSRDCPGAVNVGAVSWGPTHIDLFWSSDGFIASAWWDKDENNALWSTIWNGADVVEVSRSVPGPAAVSRINEHIDVFWVTSNGAVWTAWRDDEFHEWHSLQIAPPGSALTQPVAVCRTKRHIDVFWVGPDGSVQSAFWDQDFNNGLWSATFAVAGAGSAVDCLAALSRTPQRVDLFWGAPDGSLKTAWWDQNFGGGKLWNGPFSIAVSGSCSSGSVSCVSRFPEHIDVFWTTREGSVATAWWDQKSLWNPSYRVVGPGIAGAGVVSAISRNVNQLDLFWASVDGSVQTAWRNETNNSPSWNSFPVAPPRSTTGTARTLGITGKSAVARLPFRIDTFAVALDGSVVTAWWDHNVNGGQWNPAFPISQQGVARLDSVTAVSRLPYQLDVFWADAKGQVWTAWWNDASNSGRWNDPYVISDGAQSGSIVALARLPYHMDVFWVAANGSVVTTSWDEQRIQENPREWPWRSDRISAPQTAEPRSLTAVSRLTNQIDIFWIAPDGSVWTNWWNSQRTNSSDPKKGAWYTAFQIAGPGSAQPGSLAAVARLPYQLDVFWVGTDEAVWTAWWNENLNGAAWNVQRISVPGTAKAGSLSAVSRLPYQLDVFWVGVDGSIWTNWWNQNVNNGRWNTPFTISPPESARPGLLSAVARLPYQLDVFWTAPNDEIITAWWDQNANSGHWNAPFPVIGK
jgi:hypothetical protein